MRPLSDAVIKVTGKTFSRKYVALGRVLNHWPDIVGHDFASKAQPVKIHYRPQKEIKGRKAKPPEATLEISTSTADATVMHYQKDLIIERMNQIFGEKWITSVRFVTTPANAVRTVQKPRIKKPLSAEKKNYLSGALASIQDDDMKQRLESLGASILTK